MTNKKVICVNKDVKLERVHLFIELWSGKLIEQEHGHFQATVQIAKQLQKKYGPDVKWACVYTESEILHEYIDDWYEDFLNTLYTRSPNNRSDLKYYKNLLSKLNNSNPILFEKYLDWLQEINENKSK